MRAFKYIFLCSNTCFFFTTMLIRVNNVQLKKMLITCFILPTFGFFSPSPHPTRLGIFLSDDFSSGVVRVTCMISHRLIAIGALNHLVKTLFCFPKKKKNLVKTQVVFILIFYIIKSSFLKSSKLIILFLNFLSCKSFFF